MATFTCAVGGRIFRTSGFSHSHMTGLHRDLVNDNKTATQHCPTAKEDHHSHYYEFETPPRIFITDSVCYNVYAVYNELTDTTEPTLPYTPRVRPHISTLTNMARTWFTYSSSSNKSSIVSKAYKYHIQEIEIVNGSENTSSFTSTLTTQSSFRRYFLNVKILCVVKDGWVAAVISLPQFDLNRKGCFRCPCQLLRAIFASDCTPVQVILFHISTNNRSEKFYTPWDSDIFKSYKDSCHVVLVDFYSNWAKLTKLWTQSATFLRVWFISIKQYTEKWLKIGIAPTARTIPSSVPNARRGQLRLSLLQRFIYICFKKRNQACFNGFVFKGYTYITRVGMFVADQPEERTVIALKRNDSDMDCSHCTLQSRIRNVQPAWLPWSSETRSSSDEDGSSVW